MPDYLQQLKVRLVNMGATNEREALKVITKKTGAKFKKISCIAQEKAQQILVKLISQEVNKND